MSRAWYNDNDPYCCGVLRSRMADGRIMEGDVDDRDIRDVRAEDLAGYTRVHAFAGIAGWDLALQLAGWPAERPVWTASCPCPPFSCAGKKKRCPECQGKNLMPHPYRTGVFVCCDCQHEWDADGRHLWPELRRLIEECRPATVFGEQVESPDGLVWLAGVQATVEVLGYAFRRTDLPAACVAAPHRRQRLWWMADSDGRHPGTEGVQRGRQHRQQPSDYGNPIWLAQAERQQEGYGEQTVEGPAGQRRDRPAIDGDPGALVNVPRGGTEPEEQPRQRGGSEPAGPWDAYAVVWCDERAAGKGLVPRRVPESAFRVVDDGLPSRLAEDGYPLAVGVKDRAKMLRAIGNAIVPAVAAKFITACMTTGD